MLNRLDISPSYTHSPSHNQLNSEMLEQLGSMIKELWICKTWHSLIFLFFWILPWSFPFLLLFFGAVVQTMSGSGHSGSKFRESISASRGKKGWEPQTYYGMQLVGPLDEIRDEKKRAKFLEQKKDSC